MNETTRRYWANTYSPGWIDMKFDPADGKERDTSEEFYRKDRVNGWIQGRGLESLTTHLRWLGTLPGYDILKKNGLLSTAESLYAKLMASCFPESGLRGYFVMNPSGEPIGPRPEEGKTTLSHLFILRGLMAHAGYQEYSADLARIVPALRTAVDAAIRGECLNDQIGFSGNGVGNFPASRKGYEGQMISIGACELLFAHTRAEEDLARGVEVIRTTLAAYISKDIAPGPLMIDALDREGLPLRENGHLTANPGHSIEFVGLALQFFRHAATIAAETALNPALMTGWDDMAGTLRDLALRCNAMGRALHGGIVKSVDAETGMVLDGNCPWWSSFEAIRTFAELYTTERDQAGKQYCVDQMKSYLRCVEDIYLKPSSIGIPVQTVSIAGTVVPIIPATPDIDPGYHTGMPLLDAYEIAGSEGTMLCGSAEAEIPARPGVILQGHIARAEPSDREMDPLRVRCCRFASAATQAILLSADVLEFSREWSEAFTRRVAATHGIPEGNIFLLATHTHTAPSAIDLGMLKSDKTFLASLETTMSAAILAAGADMSPSVGALCATTVEGIGINRRFPDPETGKVSMRPNYSGEIDEEVKGFFIFDAAGRLRTVLVNMAVHPTTLGVSIHETSADYPGRIAANLRREFGRDVVVIPIQGACGDIRPMVLDGTGTEFAEGTERDIERIGEAIADRLAVAFADIMTREPKWIDGNRLAVSTRDIDLPFAYLPTCAELEALAARTEADIARSKGTPEKPEGFAASHENPLLTAETCLAWARGQLGTSFDASRTYIGPESIPARFSLLALGGSLLFFTLPGEAFCRIGKTLKRRALPTDMIVCGYSGGSVGYIPTKAAFAEGGYEVEAAFRFYGLPAPLSPDTENMIYELFDSMKEEVGICPR